MIQRRSDLGAAPEAMPHHARQPIWVGGAGMHHAGNLFGQTTGAW
eukprot:CAMPEP_0184406478 /NCGR_PEP_ID=MMETSP0738-20130409/1635_1 /TAXON_ID=385413 /ORGANISM="Thalassiosira miniscula, Strain CCMP1093" /LENGTH=44 /DNA_ID= /DNA_START= /DNA_END= /DNA_ORIENTATION=